MSRYCDFIFRCSIHFLIILIVALQVQCNALGRMFRIGSFVEKVVFKLSLIDDLLAVLINRSVGY